MNSIVPHWEAATPDCRRAFEFLQKQPFVKDYYLAGGTALALQIGHRISTDLDWFSPTAMLRLDPRNQIRQILETSGDFNVTSQDDGLLFGRLLGAAVSFLYLHIPLLKPAVNIDGAAVASPVDIGLMKLVAIRDRGRRRDFVDLYCLKDAAPLDELIEAAEVKYAAFPDFLPTAARGLAYFDDAEREAMPKMLRRVRWSEVKKHAEAGAKAIVQRERAKRSGLPR